MAPTQDSEALDEESKKMEERIRVRKRDVIRDVADYRSFAQNSNLDPLSGRTLIRFLAGLSKAAPGTRHTKAKNIVANIHRDPSEPTFADVLLDASIAAAKAPGKHAQDATLDDIVSALDKTPAGQARTHAVLMTLVGIRNVDINYITDVDQVFRVEDALLVEVRIAKNRTDAGERVTLTVHDSWSAWNQLPRKLQEDVLNFEPFVVDVGKVIRLMKRAIAGCTSYTLRRNYIHRVIAFHTDAKGHTDWKAVTAKTLHFEEKHVKAYYAKHASDLKREAAEKRKRQREPDEYETVTTSEPGGGARNRRAFRSRFAQGQQ